MRAKTSQPVHEIIATRRSPRSLDPTIPFTDQDLLAALEAARWAPSAFNGQPWRFFVGRKQDETFSKILSTLVPFNQSWAKNASALIVIAAKTIKEDGTIHADYQYDCGLAAAQMVFEVHNRHFFAANPSCDVTESQSRASVVGTRDRFAFVGRNDDVLVFRHYA